MISMKLRLVFPPWRGVTYLTSMCLVRECWTRLHEMAMAAFESQRIDKDTYSASAEDIKVLSCFLDDQLTNLSPPRNCMPSNVLLRKSRQLDLIAYSDPIDEAMRREPLTGT
ncbi:hypothetical protein Tco_1205978 [Tanacetum coccineum]